MLRRPFATLTALALLGLTAPAMAQDTKTVETENGPVAIPLAPERVVAMYSTDNDYALIMGLPLVGAGTARGGIGQGFTDYQLELGLSPDAAPINIFPEPNFEQVAALRPDLIFGAPRLDNGYALQSAIAPTLWYVQPGTDWRVTLRYLGEAFDKTDVAESFIADFDTHAAELAAKVEPDTTLALINRTNDGRFQIMQADAMSTWFDDLGYVAAENVPPTITERQQYSIENIDLLADADVLLLWRSPSEDGGRVPFEYDDMVGSPGWDELPAVKSGRVYEMPAELFYRSPLVAKEILGFAEANTLKD